LKKLLVILAMVIAFSGCSGNESQNGTSSTDTVSSGVVSGTDNHTETTAKEESKPKQSLEYKNGVYYITEENYVYGVAEIYNNFEAYAGARIEFEGVYLAEMRHNEMFYLVYREVKEKCDDEDGHHHHSHDTTKLGFRIAYDGNKPNDNSFVRVSGYVDTYFELNGEPNVIIDADVLEVCETEGNVEIEY